MAKLIYPYDSSGVAATNKITNELRSVQPPASVDQPSFIILRAAPFFNKSVSIYTGANKTGTKLIEGKDYFFSHAFVAGTNQLGNPLSGSIVFTNSLYNGNVYVEYQTLGGDFILNDAVVLEELTRRLYPDIMRVVWDQLEGVPSAFPPNAHIHPVTEIKTLEDIYYSLEKIAGVLVSGVDEGTGDAAQALAMIIAHLSAASNAHTPSAVGLSNVRNYAIATYTDANDNRADRYVSPFIVTYMFQKLTEELNPAEMRDDITVIQEDIDGINLSISTIKNTINNINLAISNTNTAVQNLERSIQQLALNGSETANLANAASTVAAQALSQAMATDSNMMALAEDVNNIIYGTNSFLPPGTHHLVIPPGTAMRVELIGGGGGSGKWFSLSTDAILTGGSIQHGEDSVLWYAGSRNVPLEPIPLLIAGGGKAGLNSYGNIGRSNAGAGGVARRFKGANINLSEIIPANLALATDLVLAPVENNGVAGINGDTANTQNVTGGVGGFAIDSSADGYHQVYGKGTTGNSKAGTGGSAAKWDVTLRNDTSLDAIFIIKVGKAGASARASLTDETTFTINDLIQTSGVAMLTLVS